MKVFTVFASLACLAEAVTAFATLDASLMESLRAVPEGWYSVGKPDEDKRIQLRIAMNQPNHALFEQTLYEISTPSHPTYGQHLKRDELKAMLRPDPVATNAVLEWLENSGISRSDYVDDGDWINFMVTVSQAEAMLNTTFNTYRSIHKKLDKVRALHYSVPEQLHKYIDMIQPTTRFGQIRPEHSEIIDVQYVGQAHQGLNTTACNSTITPACLKSLYNVQSVKVNTQKDSFLGINGFLQEYARYADFETFKTDYAPYLGYGNFTYTLINGGLNGQNSTADSVEANLDVQYGLALSYPVKGNFYSTGGLGELVPDLDQPDPANNQNEPYLDFLHYILALPDSQLPATLTTSYGEDEQSVPEAYSRSVCSMFGQLGARGVSVLFSSGDTGVGSACQTNDGKNTTRFLPIFPAACPYLTSVGGTTGYPVESAVSFSSGGFSDRFPRPAYQDAAVETYLGKIGDTFAGLFNRTGRGFPDVAAQSRNFQVVDKGSVVNVGGTSCASPTFAGIVALLNAARLSAGQPRLGFLNPFIYGGGFRSLNDITLGGSKGCTGTDIYSGLKTPVVVGASFNATEGWDPVTGYGTPNFEKLLSAVLPGRYRPRA